MQAGLWRETTEMTDQASTQQETCSSVQSMDEYLLSLQLQDGFCHSTLVSNEASRAELHLRCEPVLITEALGTLEVTSTSPDAYRVHLRMHIPADGNQAQSIQHFERLGACEQ